MLPFSSGPACLKTKTYTEYGGVEWRGTARGRISCLTDSSAELAVKVGQPGSLGLCLKAEIEFCLSGPWPALRPSSLLGSTFSTVIWNQWTGSNIFVSQLIMGPQCRGKAQNPRAETRISYLQFYSCVPTQPPHLVTCISHTTDICLQHFILGRLRLPPLSTPAATPQS